MKGSTVDRESQKDAGTLKDINFMDKCNNPEFLLLPTREAQKKYSEIEKDVAFLRGCGLMDYSLLIGIESLYAPNLGAVDTRPTALTSQLGVSRESKNTGSLNVYSLNSH